MSNYRDEKGNGIDKDAWLILLQDAETNKGGETIIDYLGYSISVKKRYCGNAQKIYAVEVDCSEDITKYHGYNIPYQGEASAENDYQRVIIAITNDLDIFEETRFSILGDIALFFDARYNTHVVNVLTSPEAFTYATREEAQDKFDELIGA